MIALYNELAVARPCDVITLTELESNSSAADRTTLMELGYCILSNYRGRLERDTLKLCYFVYRFWKLFFQKKGPNELYLYRR